MGISLNDAGNNTPGSILGVTLGVDAVEQFTLLTDTFPAEYGNAAGGVVNAITRSGTDQYHGSTHFILDVTARSMRLTDLTLQVCQIPEYRRHQYGGSAGGPIKREKAFWFADYEAIDLLSGATSQLTVPTPSFWSEADPKYSNVSKSYIRSLALTGSLCAFYWSWLHRYLQHRVEYDRIVEKICSRQGWTTNSRRRIALAAVILLTTRPLLLQTHSKNELESTLTHRQGVSAERIRGRSILRW